MQDCASFLKGQWQYEHFQRAPYTYMPYEEIVNFYYHFKGNKARAMGASTVGIIAFNASMKYQACQCIAPGKNGTLPRTRVGFKTNQSR